MKNLRSFAVYLFIFVIHLSFHESESSYMSNWTTLLWVKAEAGVSPLDVWANSSYPTNSSNSDFSLERLLSTNVTVFRSGKIDNWSVRKPSRLRLLFLSESGSPLIIHDFNSSDANSTEWFSAANLVQTSLSSSDQFNITSDLGLISLSRLQVTFGVHSQQDGVFGLYAGALKYNSSQYFLFSTDGSLLYLPGRGFDCMQLIDAQLQFHMMLKMQNFMYNRLDLCASFCRLHNFSYSFLYFDFGRPLYFRYGSITVENVNVSAGSSLTLELSYKLVPCNETEEDFHIKTINITINGSTTHIPFGETIGIVCAKLKLKDTAEIVNYNVTLNASYIKGPAFLTAPILAVQAAWEMCDCDCRVYHILYGNSPYKNMTYAEKEQALQNTIAKMKRVLTVNKSELSAKIRKKTSAEDSRVSAVVIGYTLGIAFLCCSLGSIILFDLPRLLEGYRTLIHNLTGR